MFATVFTIYHTVAVENKFLASDDLLSVSILISTNVSFSFPLSKFFDRSVASVGTSCSSSFYAFSA